MSGPTPLFVLIVFENSLYCIRLVRMQSVDASFVDLIYVSFGAIIKL